MCKELKVRKLPKHFTIRGCYHQWGMPYSRDAYEEVYRSHRDLVREDVGDDRYGVDIYIITKLKMLEYVKEYLKGENFTLDEYNGLPPTRLNLYRGYEFTVLWIWSEIVWFLKHSESIKDAWYKKYGAALSSVFTKYPKITGMLITLADLHLPGNRLLDYAKMDKADFDGDHTDEGLNDEKAQAFKDWVLDWCANATEKDKMRVKNWFETKKSHKQIFAEINKVVGNTLKFNCRLALFVERLFNQEGLDYFFEKTGFDSKEDLFMAYFDKLTQFDDETKKSFIKKYLLG